MICAAARGLLLHQSGKFREGLQVGKFGIVFSFLGCITLLERFAERFEGALLVTRQILHHRLNVNQLDVDWLYGASLWMNSSARVASPFLA